MKEISLPYEHHRKENCPLLPLFPTPKKSNFREKRGKIYMVMDFKKKYT